MALPVSRQARVFYQTAKQRYEDAIHLMKAGRTTGAAYMAGYGVECMLKALILVQVPVKTRNELVGSFRGARAHDYRWLKSCYFKHGGAAFPKQAVRAFSLVDTWNTDWRYLSGTMNAEDAKTVIKAAGEAMVWLDERM